MKKLHEIYKLYPDDTRYRGKVSIVIASDSIEEVLTTIAHPQTYIKSAAATLRADILSYFSAIKDHHWPPTVVTVTVEYGSPPDLVKLLLNTILYSGKKNINKLDALLRLVDSFCADFVHAVTKGEVITLKHYLLSLGMRNMTGQKLPIQIVNKLGHCISYPKT